MENEEFKLLMKARQNVYDLLRCFFLQAPEEKFLAAFKEENILNNLRGFSKDLDEGVELIASALHSRIWRSCRPPSQRNLPAFL